MLRACFSVVLAFGLFTAVLSLRLSVSRAHAQPAELPGEAPFDATSQTSAAETEQPAAQVWQPKRFPRLYVVPQQSFDDERAPIHERNRRPTRYRSGLLLGGLTTFAASYLVTAAFSLLYLDQLSASDCAAGNLTGEACARGARLRIPLVGPFLHSTSGSLGTLGTAWFGGTQLVGVVLTMLGVVRLVTKGDQPSRVTATIEMHPVPLPGGGLLATRITF